MPVRSQFGREPERPAAVRDDMPVSRGTPKASGILRTTTACVSLSPCSDRFLEASPMRCSLGFFACWRHLSFVPPLKSCLLKPVCSLRLRLRSVPRTQAVRKAVHVLRRRSRTCSKPTLTTVKPSRQPQAPPLPFFLPSRPCKTLCVSLGTAVPKPSELSGAHPSVTGVAVRAVPMWVVCSAFKKTTCFAEPYRSLFATKGNR